MMSNTNIKQKDKVLVVVFIGRVLQATRGAVMHTSSQAEMGYYATGCLEQNYSIGLLKLKRISDQQEAILTPEPQQRTNNLSQNKKQRLNTKRKA